MIEWVVTSSALILLVSLLRLLVRERVSPRLRYALWALVLLRLLIPVSLWESPASVLNAAQTNDGYQLVSTLPDHMEIYENGNWRIVAGPEGTFKMEPGAAGRWEDEQPRLYNAYGWAAVRDAEEAQSLREQGQKAVDNTALKWMVDVQSVLRTVWRSGVWLTEGFLLVVNLKFYLDLRKKRCPDGTYQGRDIYIVDGLPTPCLFGLFRPGIYLRPEVAENETARMHVLAHEYTHFRQWDHIWAVLRGVCLALHWYNPLVWLAAVLSRRDCELSCDEGAVRILGEESRADYGRTLVGLVARRTTAADLACCATTMTGGKSALKERIALLVKRPRTTAVTACVVAAACAVFAVCTFTGAAEAEEPDTPAEPAQTEQEPVDEPEPEFDPVPATENSFILDIPDDLPTELMDLSRPAEEQGEWLLLAELPEDDIAVYYDQQSIHPGSLIRYGDHLQKVREPLEGTGWYHPELYFKDMDGDGEKELAVIYNAGRGTGTLQFVLVVFEWGGESWTGYTANLEQGIIEDFNANHTLTIYPEEGHAVVGYGGEEITVDMDARFGNRSLWAGEGTVCELQELMYSYSMESYGLSLKIGGEIRPAGYPPTGSYAFDYICNVYYEGNGAFRSACHYLDTDYRWYPTADVSRLTPAFRRILMGFIDECRQISGGGDISENQFAVLDVNGDGKDELITQLNNTITAGQVERVYDADGSELLAEYPMITYYDNGYATAGWSHSQGAAGDKLWPYTLFRYDAAAGEYARIAAVDGWDKSIRDTYLSYDETVIPFPDDVDKDGDGFVYYVITEDGGYAPVYGTPMDYADYALWVARYLGANAAAVAYFPLTEENIALIEQN